MKQNKNILRIFALPLGVLLPFGLAACGQKAAPADSQAANTAISDFQYGKVNIPGKTTLLMVIAGLDAPESGELILNGEKITAPERLCFSAGQPVSVADNGAEYRVRAKGL